VRQRFVQAQHGVGLQQLEAGNRQFAAQVEELVLDHHQQLAHVVGQRLGQQHAEAGVQLVDVAHGGTRRWSLGTRLPSPRPVVPSSPVRVAICVRRFPMPVGDQPKSGETPAATAAKPGAKKKG
jgi:hypothetical protein